jgi:hypothetical protein
LTISPREVSLSVDEDRQTDRHLAQLQNFLEP